MNIDAPHLLTLYEAGLIIVCLQHDTSSSVGCVRRSAHQGARLLSALFTSSEKRGGGGGVNRVQAETRIATRTVSSTLKCSCEAAVCLFLLGL